MSVSFGPTWDDGTEVGVRHALNRVRRDTKRVRAGTTHRDNLRESLRQLNHAKRLHWESIGHDHVRLNENAALSVQVRIAAEVAMTYVR